jgi:uncharacterized metal-binding protein YceD (DUF177 family)
VKAYRINIAGLSNSNHHFEFEIGDQFFTQFGTDLLSKGSFHADIELDKHETFIEVDFVIKGVASLICDRSLEPFDYPVHTSHKMIFKYGDDDQEITDEIAIINREAVSLELGQYLYEFIALSVPMKKLHPRFQDEEEDGEGSIVYTSGGEEEDDDDKEDNNDIDPRWEQLKKLK